MILQNYTGFDGIRYLRTQDTFYLGSSRKLTVVKSSLLIARWGEKKAPFTGWSDYHRWIHTLTPMPFAHSSVEATSTHNSESPVVSPPAPVSQGSIGICVEN